MAKKIAKKNIEILRRGLLWGYIFVAIFLDFLGAGTFLWGVDVLVLGILLVTLGIPHGAMDFWLWRARRPQEKLWIFWLDYFLILVGVLLLWWVAPVVALAIFVFLSCHHFGQSHLVNWRIRPWWARNLGFWFWGAAVFVGILFLNWAVVVEILREIVVLDSWGLWVAQWRRWLILVLNGLWIAVVAFFGRISWQNFLGEIFLMGSLILAAWWGGVLWVFGLYFGLWHAVESLEEFAAEGVLTWRRVWTIFVPMGVMSVGGFVFFLWWGVARGRTESLIFWVFVLLSVVTFPHARVIEKFYAKLFWKK